MSRALHLSLHFNYDAFVFYLGVTAFYHGSSAALFKAGQLICAIEEERFSRIKFDSSFPIQAIRYCLREANISIREIQKIIFYENPGQKILRQIEMYEDISQIPLQQLRAKQNLFENIIKKYFGSEIEIEFSPHHLSHAANAQYYSNDNHSAHLVADAVGERETFWLGEFKDGGFKRFDKVRFPHSLGMLYSTFGDFLGFRVNADEYKLMGLAAYGSPNYAGEILKLLKNYKNQAFELNMDYFKFHVLPHQGNYTDKFLSLFKDIPKVKNGVYQQEHKNLAASIQKVTETVLLEKVKYLRQESKANTLCLSGGIALNCLANMKIEQQGLFEHISIPPNPGDAGSSLGAVCSWLYQNKIAVEKPKHAFWGFQSRDRFQNYFEKISMKNICPEREMIKALKQGRVIAVFEGKSEFGPRALGHRSILANPMLSNMKDILNKKVKQRESFRPFAPIIKTEAFTDYFEAKGTSPYMTKTYFVKPEKRALIPSAVHEDGTARVQTIDKTQTLLYHLLELAERELGVPILINTSFNLSDEPIVNTEIDAFVCFLRSGIDLLYLNGLLIDEKEISEDQKEVAKKLFKDRNTELDRNSYRF